MTFHTESRTYQTANDAQWQAILANDAEQDGHFFYAVVSTGIFCRPSCISRPPKRENVLVFAAAEQARAARFTPNEYRKIQTEV